MITKYSTKETNGQHILLINGIESACPFKSNIAVPNQNQFGQATIEILSFPCSTTCPHAIFDKLGTDDTPTYSIDCTGITKDFDIETEPEQQNTLKLI